MLVFHLSCQVRKIHTIFIFVRRNPAVQRSGAQERTSQRQNDRPPSNPFLPLPPQPPLPNGAGGGGDDRPPSRPLINQLARYVGKTLPTTQQRPASEGSSNNPKEVYSAQEKLAREMFGKEKPMDVIPAFYRPMAHWAKQIRAALGVKGYHDLTDPGLSRYFVGPILRRIPPNTCKLPPSVPLNELLDFLGGWDPELPDVGKYFDNNAQIKTSPFCTFYEICTDIQLTDPFCTEEGARHIAWASVLRRLPKSLQTLVSTFRIVMYPTPEQWYDINAAYLAHVRSLTRGGTPNQLVAAVIPPPELVANANYSNQNNSETPVSDNRPRAPVANASTRPPMKDLFPSRKDLCWYHQKFGIKAKTCGKNSDGNKCGWVVNLPPRAPRTNNNTNNNNQTAQLSAVSNPNSSSSIVTPGTGGNVASSSYGASAPGSFPNNQGN